MLASPPGLCLNRASTKPAKCLGLQGVWHEYQFSRIETALCFALSFGQKYNRFRYNFLLLLLSPDSRMIEKHFVSSPYNILAHYSPIRRRLFQNSSNLNLWF